ncbi:hypothetical protein B0T11DRAFT_24956 [Plectosphaerella cucumerina]|uniref:Uncharacterized protein n=1 Tax=Plectosphaerella cucumerina TaxID=40658 RepID=A0A8K0TR01_9PEZI|nr:hypothetical protein B0T11DRAFT_24956 [Plectosphaerella cucumerina]
MTDEELSTAGVWCRVGRQRLPLAPCPSHINFWLQTRLSLPPAGPSLNPFERQTLMPQTFPVFEPLSWLSGLSIRHGDADWTALSSHTYAGKTPVISASFEGLEPPYSLVRLHHKLIFGVCSRQIDSRPTSQPPQASPEGLSRIRPSMSKKIHTTPGIRWSSPTQLLIQPSLAYLWESGRDPEFSDGCGRM